MSDVPLYKINNVTYGYNSKFQLIIPEFTIQKGASVGLVGPNGGGKSTFLKLLSFLESPLEGTIYFNGIRVDKNNIDITKSVTILLQEPYLLKRSVFENVAYGLRVRGEKHNIPDRVYEALNLLGLDPEEFAQRKWHALSGGEAQRVSLASRLILKPEVLILDEPTASVDRQSALLIKKAVTTMRERFHTTLIVASHDLVWLNSVTEEIHNVHEGNITGYAAENLIEGPWVPDYDGLWKKILSDGQEIVVASPPNDPYAAALLNPSDIMIALERPTGISAQNILRGVITTLSQENHSDKVLVVVDIDNTLLTCRLTRRAAEMLHLLPGTKVLILFKASSLHWQ